MWATPDSAPGAAVSGNGCFMEFHLAGEPRQRIALTSDCGGWLDEFQCDEVVRELCCRVRLGGHGGFAVAAAGTVDHDGFLLKYS